MITVGDPRAALFASDLHLDETQPALTARFVADLDRRLAAPAGEPPTLFLLGDLFEFWIGDDRLTAPALTLAARLAALVARGGRVFLMHGNRDFLIDAPLPTDGSGRLRYSARCHATLLADPTVVAIGGRRVALAHGDALCTDDTGYQQWRALCRSPAWQQAFLAKPIAERHAMAVALRSRSRDQQQQRAAMDTLGDVADTAADALMTELDCDLLIHGHTHQPALHRWQHQDQPRLRWVLPDWSAGADGPARGAVLSLADGLSSDSAAAAPP
ncbi:MAG: UDP-2,3-diacylglucosamine diphosphatase [Lautropia sp.]